ncbi:MAG: DUF3021 domain-containing protein [Oscillospiraceae bacterium]|nr:DUF3021 domain-containing protein [Oscillospiraceae bacterium]
MLMKALRRCAIGFPIGILVSLAISLLSYDGKLVSDVLVARVGSETGALVLDLVLSGIFGAICMAGTVFYEIEHWSLAKATFLHYVLIILSFPPLALFLGWVSKPSEILIMTASQTICFFLIWLFMYLRYRAEVRELNELNARQEQKQKDGTE